jgi:hypothetical protein
MQIVDVIRLGKAKHLKRYEEVVPATTIAPGSQSGFYKPGEVQQLLNQIWGIDMFPYTVDELEELDEEELDDEDYEDGRHIDKKLQEKKEIAQYLGLYREFRGWLRRRK